VVLSIYSIAKRLKEIKHKMKKQLKRTKNLLAYTGFAMLIFTFFISCAGTGKMSTFQMDEILVAAGFQLQKADTPKKLSWLKSLPQNELVHKLYNKKKFYFFVDGSSCQCMYVGDEKAYLHFKQLVKEKQMEKRIDTDSRQARDETENFPVDPNSPFDIGGHLP
jgi:hypothetical protein